MVMKCNKIRLHTCEGESFVLTKLTFIRFQASCCCYRRAGKQEVISRRWIQAIRPTVHTRSRSCWCHVLRRLCRCVSICISTCTAIGNIGTAFPNTYILLDSILTNTDTSPGLSLRLGLQRYQAKPEPISSLAQHITKRHCVTLSRLAVEYY